MLKKGIRPTRVCGPPRLVTPKNRCLREVVESPWEAMDGESINYCGWLAVSNMVYIYARHWGSSGHRQEPWRDLSHRCGPRRWRIVYFARINSVTVGTTTKVSMWPPAGQKRGSSQRVRRVRMAMGSTCFWKWRLGDRPVQASTFLSVFEFEIFQMYLIHNRKK